LFLLVILEKPEKSINTILEFFNLNAKDLVSSLVSLSKKFSPKDDEDEDDDEDYDEEDEYILTDVDEIEELTIFEKK
jgi:hypothetical protein